MKKLIHRLLSLRGNERGAASVLTAFFIGLFGLGFAALVIDASLLYAKRSEMITSADSAALAGANYIREQVVLGKVATSTEVVNAAKTIARSFAIDNNADPDEVDVYIGMQDVEINGDTLNLQVVDVKVGDYEPSLFARVFGDEENLVVARATATWGYVKKTYVGNILPLFAFDFQEQTGSPIYLHGLLVTEDGTALEPNNSNAHYYIDPVDGNNGIDVVKDILEGDYNTPVIIEDSTKNGLARVANVVFDSIEERMKAAAKTADYPTAAERREKMMGLVPIINWDDFWNDTRNFNGVNTDLKLVNDLYLKIDHFAYFEITDTIKANKDVGSVYALNPNNDPHSNYLPTGVAKDYSAQYPDKTDADVMIGYFTGEKVDASILIGGGDQTDPTPDVNTDSPATYAKLIR